MHRVKFNLERFSDVTLQQAIGETGLYVLWSPRAQARPSYIGEGYVLSRLVEHQRKYGLDVDGYFGAADPDLTVKQAKRDQEIAECALILVGGMIGRPPTHNGNAGRLGRILGLSGKHGVLQVVISGRDPFQPPESPQSKLHEARTIRFDLEGLGRDEADIEDLITHPWRRTR